jgi:hypothetical protein
MGRGLLAGAFWGGLLGALVLVVAALVLEGRKPDLGAADGGAPVAAAPTALPPPPDRAPTLAAGAAQAVAPPDDTSARARVPQPDTRGLLPRPPKPDLVPLSGLQMAPDLLAADVPPRAVVSHTAPDAAPTRVVVPLPAAGDKVPGPLARSIAAPPARSPAPGPMVAAAETLPTQAPSVPEAPVPVIVGGSGPNLSAGTIPPASGDMDLRAAVPAVPAQGATVARAAAPGRPARPGASPMPRAWPQAAPAPPALLASALRTGPRIAAVLAPGAAPSRPLPEWIMTGPDGAQTPFRARLVQGGDATPTPADASPLVYPPDATPAFVAARTHRGARPLLAYARLDTASDATRTTLQRIAARARRDGAVTVLVGDDPALWDLLEAWLGGRARDLVPVPAAALLP